MMRKFHTKSRLGCAQCKLRRSKCDEARPSCGRCSKYARRCSFVTDIPVLPPPRPPLVGQLPLPSGPTPDERYGSLHLSLLYHFEHDHYHHTKSLHPGLNDMLSMFIKVGLTTPYLMDEILAYSAAHKSTVGRERSQHCLSEAARLQTRSLTLYNSAAPQISEETCLPMFIFSSLMSHHVIFSVSSSAHSGLGAIIDGLARSTFIHRGLVNIAKTSWPMFSEQTQQQFIRSCKRDYEPVPSSPDTKGECDTLLPDTKGECDTLLRRLDAADMKPASIVVLRAVVENLQDRFDALCSNDSHTTWSAVQDWLVATPVEYFELLEQRRPEALVVLAYFAVLLHRATEHWFVGDLGIRLLCLVNGHLGNAWEDWLEWPNRSTAVHHKLPQKL